MPERTQEGLAYEMAAIVAARWRRDGVTLIDGIAERVLIEDELNITITQLKRRMKRVEALLELAGVALRGASGMVECWHDYDEGCAQCLVGAAIRALVVNEEADSAT